MNIRGFTNIGGFGIFGREHAPNIHSYGSEGVLAEVLRPGGEPVVYSFGAANHGRIAPSKHPNGLGVRAPAEGDARLIERTGRTAQPVGPVATECGAGGRGKGHGAASGRAAQKRSACNSARLKCSAAELSAMSEPTLDDDAMTRFEVPEFVNLPEDLQDRISEEHDEAGFTPNVFSAFASKPSHFRAFFEYHDALVDDTALDREEVEMIVVAVSGRNHCYYCNVAHGALLRIYSGNPELADQLVANYRQADISEKRLAMLDVAVKLTEAPDEVTEADLERLAAVGYSAEAMWDIAAVTAFFNLSNRMAMFADMRPNEEFHTMGR